MNANNKPNEKTNKSGKSASRLGALVSSGNSKSPIPALVPPVLREVGKLAAGVASVSTTNLSSGSATGNPRNKVALQPGHSLIDWIRLGASGKDLTGIGSRAGTLAVTRQDLAKHNTRHDAWIAIRGRVYNITHYFPFHPGGEDELMKGAGIDATKLFEEVHPWVNYEQILQKCLIGRLVAVDPNIDTETLLFGEKNTPPSAKSTLSSNRLDVSPANSSVPAVISEGTLSTSTAAQPSPLPRFDWIQKLDYITVIFYTKSFSNPLVEINCPIDNQTVQISLTYENSILKNEIVFFDKVRWPCDINVAVETGKVEFMFRKNTSGIWENYGVLRQQSYFNNSISPQQVRSEYILQKKVQVNYNTWLLKFERKDGRKIVFPVGRHLRVFRTINGQEISKSYTPVPESLLNNFVLHSPTEGNICLMIKRYHDGKMSPFIIDKNLQEEIQFSKPLGSLDLKVVEKRETFLLLAAGTGITPMLGLITFLLERRIKKCQFMQLLFFNRSERDILLRNKLEELAKVDERFKIDSILSEATNSWEGIRGHINADMIVNSIQEHIKDTGYTIKDIFCFICGPPKFNDAAIIETENAKINKEQVWIFEG